ncbi:MAG: UDP-N-acetylmuramoylalanine--D-glutamate ligase [Phycisphaerales bacterium]|nr:MAG: UDP-N-acetylmuramoylalanine--D-glutamate ligase [Phycisphaerales bacterium]
MRPLAGQRVTVMGLGRFGGGLGVARWLHAQGARVLVTDLADEATLADALAGLPGGVKLRLGGHEERDFTHADLVVANPAVPRPWDNPFLAAAARAGVPITTEIQLALARVPDRTRVVGVTGTAGKSTTCAMIARALRAASQRVHLGGNIGGSLLEATIQPQDLVVVELSSFMLHWLGQEAFSPGTAVLTNLSPNHLDWHGSLAHYEQSKRRIAAHQHAGDVLIADRWPELTVATRVPLAEPPERLALPGAHNRQNAACALTAALATLDRLGIVHQRQALADAVAGFAGLPHRLEHLGERAGVAFYNDSKSTTPQATVHAVGALAERYDPATIHLIAGGADKGADLTPIAALACELGGVHTIGTTGPTIARIAHDLGGRAWHHGTLQAALDGALGRCPPGRAVLLSPGCASWDQFPNYEARGRRFAELVARWSPRPPDRPGPGGASAAAPERAPGDGPDGGPDADCARPAGRVQRAR